MNRRNKSEFRTVSDTIDKITQDLKVFPASKIMFEVCRKLLVSKCKKKTAKLNEDRHVELNIYKNIIT